VLPALLSPGKVSIVVEPVVAIIINQVETLQCKGIDAIVMGKAAVTKSQLISNVCFSRRIYPVYCFALQNIFLEHALQLPNQAQVASFSHF